MSVRKELWRQDRKDKQREREHLLAQRKEQDER